MAKRGSGKPLTRKESFIISRQKKDGTPMNEAAGRVIEELHALEEEGVPDTYGPDDHLSRVLGPEHPGYVRGKPRTCPTRYWGSSSTSGASTSTAAPSPGPAGEQIVTLATVFQRLVRTLIPQQASEEARQTMVEFDDILGAITSTVPSSSQPVAPEVAATDGDHADAVDDAAVDSDGDDCQL